MSLQVTSLFLHYQFVSGPKILSALAKFQWIRVPVFFDEYEYIPLFLPNRFIQPRWNMIGRHLPFRDVSFEALALALPSLPLTSARPLETCLEELQVAEVPLTLGERWGEGGNITWHSIHQFVLLRIRRKRWVDPRKLKILLSARCIGFASLMSVGTKKDSVIC